jgi:hypothetical protein
VESSVFLRYLQFPYVREAIALETVESETVRDERDKKELRADIKDIAIDSPSFKSTRKPHEHFIAECQRQLRFLTVLHQSALRSGRECSLQFMNRKLTAIPDNCCEQGWVLKKSS